MALLVTMGLGEIGDGSGSGGLTTIGLGDNGTPPVDSQHAMELWAVESLGTTVVAVFSNFIQPGPTTTDPSHWKITDQFLVELPISSVEIDLHRVRLRTVEQTQGATYTFTAPIGSMFIDINGEPLGGPNSMTFLGVGSPPMFGQARALDARRLEVIFTEPVLMEDALVPANYVVTPSVTVYSVVRKDDNKVVLTTSKMDPLDTYQVALHNIRDLGGNVIDDDHP